jgi:hypothetical protein
MPVLLAYLVALAVFLGGSYEALSWLGSPQPLKTVSRPKHKAQNAVPEADTKSVAAHSEGASVASDVGPGPTVEMKTSEVAIDVKSNRSGVKEANIVDEPKATSDPSPSPMPQRDRPPSQRSQNENFHRPLRLARSSFSARPKLKLMTLETIEFADGRRTTRLVPYRGDTQALAFSGR